MKTIIYPNRKDWLKLTQRPTFEKKELNELVLKIFNAIKKDGDKGVKKYSSLFDKIDLKSLKVNEKIISDASKEVSKELKSAIQEAKRNIEKFHASQKELSKVIETTSGVYCWRETRGIEKVGIYIPAGTAPLFSTVLMLGIPAKLARCKEIILCTPPNKKGEI